MWCQSSRPVLHKLGQTLPALILCSGHPPVAASQAVTFLSQERAVVASASAISDTGSDFDGDEVVASDFEPFEATVSANAHAPEAAGAAAASQDSTIASEQILTQGSAQYWFLGGNGWGYGRGVSETNITFLVQRPTDYTLQGSLVVDGAFSRVRLLGPQGTLHDAIEFSGTKAVGFSGTLPAGQYTLEVASKGDGGNGDPGIWGGGQAEHNIALTFSTSAMPSGAVPDGANVQGAPLQVQKLAGDLLRLTWSPSCRATDVDYAVYEGPLGDPLDLAPVICSTSGNTSHDLEPAFDSSLFLVVPTNGSTEGSYGQTSLAVERPPSLSACWPQLLAEPVCP